MIDRIWRQGVAGPRSRRQFRPKAGAWENGRDQPLGIEQGSGAGTPARPGNTPEAVAPAARLEWG